MNKQGLNNNIKILLLLLMVSVGQNVFSQETRSERVAFVLNNLPDSIAPSIKILSPLFEQDLSYQTDIEFINISGKVIENGMIKFLAINSEKQTLSETGLFNSRIELYPGKNEIRLVAADSRNNLYEQFLYINFNSPGASQANVKEKKEK